MYRRKPAWERSTWRIVVFAFIVALALIYYYAFVHRRRGGWTIRDPEEEVTRSQ